MRLHQQGAKPRMFKHLLLVAALLAALCTGAAQAAHFDTQYVVKYGHANGDQLTDIYLQYRPKFVQIPFDDLSIPIPLSKAEVGEFVLLQQANGTFAASTPTPTQRAAFSSWQIAALKLLLSDVDADSNIDILIRNVSSIIPGAKNLIVYAPANAGALPAEVRPINDALVKFIRDLQGWGDNHQSYYANAWVPTVEYLPIFVDVFDCPYDNGGGSGSGRIIEEYEQGSPGIGWAWLNCDYLYTYFYEIPVPGTPAFDSANYSDAAKAIADALQPFSDETTPVSDQAMQVFMTQATSVLDRPFYPDAQPGTIDWEEFRKIIKVIARGGTAAEVGVYVVVGGILYPSETADSDLGDEWVSQTQVREAGIADAARQNDGYLYFYHTTLATNVSSILSGVSVPPKRNFPGDEPAFYLATNQTWAYALGRSLFGKYKAWVTIHFRMTITAHNTLIAGGADYRFHPPADGLGILHTTYELLIPPHLYGTFNSLMASGQIVATPVPPFRY